MKRIAVLTSGGDAPGMNAAIRAVVRTSIYNGLEVYGVNYGYKGLIEKNINVMDIYSVADIIQRGGTILYTARCMEMYEESGVDTAVETLNEYGIEGLVVIGGDGSYKGAEKLSKKGINVVTLPGTIDNDISSTEYAIGFDTAVNTALNGIARIRDTSHSHNRVNVVEVMGRNSGYIALYSGIAGGAESIIIPEKEVNIDAICEKMTKGKDRGKLHSIIVLAEGAGDCEVICKEIEKKTGVTARSTNLGYIQRGGSPSAFDRILASKMGAMAVEALLEGKTNRAMCYQKGRYLDMDIDEALKVEYKLDEEGYRIASMLSI